MKVTINKEVLQKRLYSASTIVSGRSALPILDNLLIQANNGILTIFSTDLEKYIELKDGTSIQENGVVVVDAKTLLKIIDSIPQDEDKVFLEANNSKLTIRAGKIKTSLPSLPPEDFPSKPSNFLKSSFIQINNAFQRQDDDVLYAFRIEAESLFSGIDKTQFAAAQDNARPILGGVYFSFKDDDNEKVEIVATDSYRLSISKVSFEKEKEVYLKDFIVPIKSAKVMKSVFSHYEGKLLQFSYSDSILEVSGQGISFITRLVNGEYPDYKQVIPKDFLVNLMVKKDSILNASRISSIFYDEISAITISILANEKQMKVSSSGKCGDSFIDIDCTIISGDEDIEIVLNAQYLLDVLRVVYSDNIYFGITGKHSPVLIKGEVEDDLFVIMPLKR